MAGNLIDQILESAAWVAAVPRFTNTTGTPLVSAVVNDTGELIPDVYTLTFSAVTPSTTATCHVACGYSTNPYIDGTGVSVTLDGATEYKTIIPGVTLVFSNSGSFGATWVAQVRCGLYPGTYPNYAPGAGTAGTGVRHRVKNNGAVTAENVTVHIENNVVQVRTSGIVFDTVRHFAADGVMKLTSGQCVPYAVTVENKAGSGGSLTCDIKIDAALINVENLTTGATGTSETLGVADEYKITSGDCKDVIFKISQSATNAATANILIFTAASWQIAEDVSGVEGTYGITDVTLTETGQATGSISAGGYGYFWTRPLVAGAANAKSNPYPCKVKLTADVPTAAAWT